MMKTRPARFASFPQYVTLGSPCLEPIPGTVAYILNEVFSDIKLLMPGFLVLRDDSKPQIKVRAFVRDVS